MTNEKELIKIDDKVYKKKAFIIEDDHPAIGRILIIEDMKFKILDDKILGGHKTGTYIAKLTEEDEKTMEEYDEIMDELSEKLVKKIDVKRMIKENMKNKPMQELKTGLFILEAQERGEKVDEEHHHGCYDYKLHYKNQCFQFMTGSDVLIEPFR